LKPWTFWGLNQAKTLEFEKGDQTMSTREDLRRWYNSVAHCKTGYCCYQDAGKSKYDLVELGYNAGLYGWNWTAYLDSKSNTLYVSYYRNVPSYIREK
jgi:hypothetical protein